VSTLPTRLQPLISDQFSGKRAEALEHFSSIGHPVPSEYFNPADHLMDLVSVDPRASNQLKSLERVDRLTSVWHGRASTTERGDEVAKSDAEGIKRGEGTTSMRVALPVVLERHWKNLWRRKDVSRPIKTPLTRFLMTFLTRFFSIGSFNHLCSQRCLSSSSSDSLMDRQVCKCSLALRTVGSLSHRGTGASRLSYREHLSHSLRRPAQCHGYLSSRSEPLPTRGEVIGSILSRNIHDHIHDRRARVRTARRFRICFHRMFYLLHS